MIKKIGKNSQFALSALVCICLSSVAKSIPAPRFVKHGENAQGEKRPKKLIWGEPRDGLQMAVWVSPTRPLVFGLIRNSSRRKIHYCDYLLGHAVVLYVRLSPSSDWVEVPPVPIERQINIGVLLCGSNDTLRPGQEMKASTAAFSRNRVMGNHTFEVNLDAYKFPDDWQGRYDCKVVQRIFGGRHDDAYEGDIESAPFTIRLPIASGASQ